MLVMLESASVVRMELTTLADINRTNMTNTYCCVYSVEILLMMDSGLVRNMQGTLSNKCEKLCISLAYIIRIYHDARCSECQIPLFYVLAAVLKKCA